MSRGSDREEGLVTALAVGLGGLLVTVALVCAQVGGHMVAHRRAQAGADLGALAAARALQAGGDACATAATVARANHARLLGCTLRPPRVRVQVASTAPALFGSDAVLRARAVAGPD